MEKTRQAKARNTYSQSRSRAKVANASANAEFRIQKRKMQNRGKNKSEQNARGAVVRAKSIDSARLRSIPMNAANRRAAKKLKYLVREQHQPVRHYQYGPRMVVGGHMLRGPRFRIPPECASPATLLEQIPNTANVSPRVNLRPMLARRNGRVGGKEASDPQGGPRRPFTSVGRLRDHARLRARKLGHTCGPA